MPATQVRRRYFLPSNSPNCYCPSSLFAPGYHEPTSLKNFFRVASLGGRLPNEPTIIDIVDGNKCMIDGPVPKTGVARQVIPFKRLALTDIVINELGVLCVSVVMLIRLICTMLIHAFSAVCVSL